jgi:translation initiation factor IF-3
VPEVLVIDENDQKLGVMRSRQALEMARQRNLDLVEVAPTANPPVCRFLDYGKYRYEQTKRERDAHKTQKVISVKELRLRPKIGDHDLEVKSKQAKVFLEEGHKVKMTVLFRGRENLHPDIGRQVLNEMIDLLKDSATIEQPPKMEGRNMTMVLSKGATNPSSKSSSSSAAKTQESRPAPSENSSPVAAAEGTPAPTRSKNNNATLTRDSLEDMLQ